MTVQVRGSFRTRTLIGIREIDTTNVDKEGDTVPSIRERDGRFTVLYRDASGHQRSAGTFKTKGEAVKVQRKTVDGVTQVQTVKTYSSKALATYAQSWVEGHRLEATSKEKYKSVLNKWIIPKLGERRIADITRNDIKAWVSDMEGDGAGASIIQKAWTVLSAMFSAAVEDGTVKVNLCQGIKLPPVVSPIKEILTKEDYEKLLAEIPAEYQLLIKTAVGTGCRWGELIALTSDDIDGQMIKITKTIIRVTGEGLVIKSYTKNKEHRTVKVTKELADELSEREGLLFGHLDDSWFRFKVWNPAVKRAGLNVTFHCLRHTHASWLLANGCDLLTVSKRLGHKNIKTTQGYLHTLPTAQDAAISALERAMM